MYRRDRASQMLGIEIVSVSDGSCTAAMTVTDTMVNGLDTCHGGFLFTLADTAMAFASNSDDLTAFATFAAIDFVAPARAGDRLIARSAPVHSRGRNTIHDITVMTDSGSVIALFRGHTRVVGPAATEKAANG